LAALQRKRVALTNIFIYEKSKKTLRSRPTYYFTIPKWNKIEHRMFSYITQNWRGVPLISREAIVQLIGNTTTTKGLEIQAQIDFREYRKGREVEEADFRGIAITPDKFHGEWNYIISPTVKITISL